MQGHIMKRTIKANEKITKVFQSVETKEINEETRTLVVRISTASPDRSNDEMQPAGCDITNYMKNPVVAAFHDYRKPAIAKTLEIQFDDGGIVAKLEFVPAGVNPEADMLWEMYKGGYMNAWSIGFIPVEWTQKSDRGYIFTKWELLEYSAVLVPDNADALTILRGKGLDPESVMEKLDSEVKDTELEENKETKEVDHLLDVELKDVSEVVALSYILNDLKWITQAFIDNGVNVEATDKMKQALSLLMEAVAIEATLGQKTFTVRQPENTEEVEQAAAKAAEEAKEKEVNEFLTGLRESLRGTDKEVGLTLRSLNTFLNNLKGGEK